ncbi:serum response factor-binding protein 1-like [Branchiostoma lanceolatum]|uniref:serum response factor-binding protein 1-like n=1 Tax=Branchiostoma lanceolatum TaxID=7740 RepID=UPI0034559D83
MVNFTELNKEIVLLRGDVKRARLLLIQALCRNIRKLRDKKGKPEQLAKNQHRAEKLHEDITVLKGLKPDDVTKSGLFADFDEHKVLSDPTSSSKERAMARLISHKGLKSKLDTVRGKFNIIPGQKMASDMKKSVKDKRAGNKAKKTADKSGQGETEKRPAENTEHTQTPTDSSIDKVEKTSDTVAGQSSSDGASSAGDVGEEDKISQSKDAAKASTEISNTTEIVVSSRDSESESEEDGEDSVEEMEEDVDSEEKETPDQTTESSIESKTESQVNLTQSKEDNKQSVKRTEPTTVKRTGPRKAACDAEEDEDEEEKEETTVTAGDDMFLREGEPDPEEDTEGGKRTVDSGGVSGVPAVARALPGESLFIGSLAGRSRNVKKGKFEKRTGKRPNERGSSHKFAGRGRPQQQSRAPAAGRAAKPSSAETSGHLHPSWIAKRKQKEQAGQIAAFQGKKIVFDD